MKKFSLVAVFCGFLFSCKSNQTDTPSKHANWCPQGLQVGSYARIEGIVDYEGINWCKMVVKGQEATLEVLATSIIS